MWRDKVDYSYDSEGNIIMADSDAWDGSQWVDCCRNEYVYDAEGRRIEWTSFHPDRPGWRFGIRTTWWFSQDGFVETETVRKWENSEWDNRRQYTRIRDDRGRELNLNLKFWISGRWRNGSGMLNSRSQFRSTLSISEYTDTSRVIISQVWDNGSWKNEWRFVTEYDALGRVISTLHQDWESISWRNERLSLRERTENAADTSSTTTAFDWTGEAWEPDYRSSRFGIINGQAANTIRENWIDSTWVEVSRTFTQMGIYGPIYHEQETQAAGVWTTTQRGNWEYDHLGRQLSSQWDEWNGTEWLPAQRIFSSYVQATDIERYSINSEFDLSLFPNPSHNSIHLKGSIPFAQRLRIEVFDMLGRRVMTSFGLIREELEAGYVLNISELSSGLYTVRVRTENRALSLSFVKL